MKNFIVLALGCIALLMFVDTCAAGQNNTLSHNLIIGARPYLDQLVRREQVKVSSRWFTTLKESRTFTTNGNRTITMVKALDQNLKGNGAHAALKSGGPGHQYVTLEFTSKKGHSINFIVELFAR